jgi:hypothetical protein
MECIGKKYSGACVGQTDRREDRDAAMKTPSVVSTSLQHSTSMSLIPIKGVQHLA